MAFSKLTHEVEDPITSRSNSCSLRSHRLPKISRSAVQILNSTYHLTLDRGNSRPSLVNSQEENEG